MTPNNGEHAVAASVADHSRRLPMAQADSPLAWECCSRLDPWLRTPADT